MDRTDSTDAMLNRALRLAYFIHNDKATALQIVASAMMRLETTAAAQDKRFYYTPIGRLLSDRLKSDGFRNKITLNSLDLLQLLVFIESEPYEKRKEMGQAVVQAGEEDMIIHFIKHLVTITMKRNSFYVALGMCRLLHNYSTSETMDIYSVILQDPDRTKDDHYFRSRKGRLMQEMKHRFGELISASRGPHGEERFRSLERPARYAGLVRECLDLFSPWRTLCPVPAGFNPTRDLLSCLSSAGHPIDDDHQTEVNRIHAIVHPDCFTRLTRALAFDCPDERLALPQFFTSYKGGNGHKPPSDRRRPPELERNDRAIIQQYLDEQAARRRAVGSRVFSIKVDGAELTRMNLDLSTTVRIEVDRSANLIEVIAFDEIGEVVLATHLLHLENARPHHESRYSITLGGGREISFRVEPAEDSGSEGRDWVFDICYRDPASRGFVFHQWQQARKFFLTAQDSNQRKRLHTLRALIACGIVLIVAGAGLLHRRFSAPPVRQAAIESLDGANAATTAPDDALPRDRTTSEATEKSSSELPSRHSGRSRIIASATQRKGIARSKSNGSDSTQGPASVRTPADPLSGSEATRESEADVDGASLLAVRSIYIEYHGEELMGRELRASFTAQIEASRRFKVSDPEDADAALKIFDTLIGGRHAQGHKQRQEAGIRIQLVNRTGEILWRATRRVNGKTSPAARQSAGDVFSELLHHIDELEKRRR